MTLNEYQEAASTTALGLATESAWYCALGLTGEAGEVAEKIKKYYRDGAPVGFKESLCKELGDVLWYAAMLGKFFEIDLESIGVVNIDKLAKRKAENKLHGSGDNR